MARDRSNQRCTHDEVGISLCVISAAVFLLSAFFYFLLSKSDDNDESSRPFDTEKYWSVAGGIGSSFIFLAICACFYPQLKKYVADGEGSIVYKMGSGLAWLGNAMKNCARTGAAGTSVTEETLLGP